MVLVEVIACSAKDARTAVEGGADRLEVCSAVRETAGISPSYAAFEQIRKAVEIPLAVLVRPRPGGFVYNHEELEVILHQIQWFAKNGADSIVCGALNADRTFDTDAMKSFKDAAGAIPMACHRCFDLSPDLVAAAHQLGELGFVRVLTSGGQVNALAGAGTIMRLVAEDVIEILAGSGIHFQNATELIQKTAVRQIHASLVERIEPREDSEQSHPIYFGGHYETKLEHVQQLVQAVRQ
jgi:copper homeostasis protein